MIRIGFAYDAFCFPHHDLIIFVLTFEFENKNDNLQFDQTVIFIITLPCLG